jgi:NAD(P)-dependent dehydrogenase (short-subunit alcohol dehydrogenase family)
VDPLYAMSKHAVVGLVRSLGPTLALRGIKINALCPGGIDTAIIPEVQRSDIAVFMTPEHVASEVIHLMTVEDTGKTWAKVSENKPAFIVRAPGDRP